MNENEIYQIKFSKVIQISIESFAYFLTEFFSAVKFNLKLCQIILISWIAVKGVKKKCNKTIIEVNWLKDSIKLLILKMCRNVNLNYI